MRAAKLFKPHSMSNSHPQKRTWGFRFSPRDFLVICVFAAAAVFLWRCGNPLWWMLVTVASHFFLFCNVFRIIRWRELTWASLFVLNIGAWLWFEELTWLHALECQVPITIFLILTELRSPGYHGVFAGHLNPRLNDYLEGLLL